MEVLLGGGDIRDLSRLEHCHVGGGREGQGADQQDSPKHNCHSLRSFGYLDSFEMFDRVDQIRCIPAVPKGNEDQSQDQVFHRAGWASEDQRKISAAQPVFFSSVVGFAKRLKMRSALLLGT